MDMDLYIDSALEKIRIILTGSNEDEEIFIGQRELSMKDIINKRGNCKLNKWFNIFNNDELNEGQSSYAGRVRI